LGQASVAAGALLSSISVADDLPPWGLLAALTAAMASACKSVLAHAAYHRARLEPNRHLGPLALLFWVHLCLVPPYAFASILDGELITITLNASTLNASTLNASTAHAFTANATTVNATTTAAATTAVASFFQLTATASLGGLRAMCQ